MEELIPHIAFATVLTAIGVYGLFSNLRKARIIEDTPTSKIRSASQGYVELSGFAKLLDAKPVIAPLTGETCLWYSYSVERYTRSGKSSHWRTIERNTSKACFNLNDTTGDVVVYPAGAEVNSRRRSRWRGFNRRPKPPQNSQGSFSLSTGNYRFTEHRIHHDDYLYALGMFQTFHAIAADTQQGDKMAEILSDWKQDYDTLLQRFDSNGDGELNMQEWEAARNAAAKKAQHFVNKHYDASPVNTLLKPPRGKPYLIASKDPQQLTRQYRWKAAGATCLMVAGLSYTVYIL